MTFDRLPVKYPVPIKFLANIQPTINGQNIYTLLCEKFSKITVI